MLSEQVTPHLPNPSPERLIVGTVSRPHGIVGEVKVQLWPEYSGALEGVRRIYLDDDTTPYRVRGYREHQGAALLVLDRVADRNAAEALRGARVSISVTDLPDLPEGAYYAHQLVGMHIVRAESGEPIGTLVEVLATGSNDVYVVKKAEGELLLPVIESVVRAVDLATGTIRVVVPDGLE